MRKKLPQEIRVLCRHRGRGGFSLVEVVLAIGVAALCLIPILGLLPAGLTTNRENVQESAASRLAEGIATDLRSTTLSTSMEHSPIYNIQVPSSGSPLLSFVTLNEDGSAHTNSSGFSSGTLYLASVTVTPASSDSLQAAQARILITWPAPATTPTAIPANFSGSFETEVGLERN